MIRKKRTVFRFLLWGIVCAGFLFSPFSFSFRCPFCLSTAVSVQTVSAQAVSAEEISIRLEIFCDGPLQPMAAQQWGSALNSLGFYGVQIRGGDSSDVLDIRPLGGGLYAVSGMLTSGDRILLPGNVSFSLGQIRGMKPYLEEQILLLEQSEAASADTADTQAERDALFQELAEPVGFSTRGVSRKKVLQELAHSFETHIRFPVSIRKMFDGSDLVTEELRSVSRGTALVYVLRYLGYCVVPEKNESSAGYTLRILPADQADPQRILPVGYPAETASPDVLFERFNANVDGVSAARILNSLQERLDIPFLYDFNSMAGQGIELEEVTIRQKPGRFSYKKLLDAVLYQAKLQREVRIDESGQVFFWISTIRSSDLD